MTTRWDEYVGLHAELSGLDETRARGLAEAEAAYHLEARRLQNELSSADRELTAVKDRSARLQVGVRDLARGLAVAVPPATEQAPLELAQLRDALTSAEYDLRQLRTSVDYVKRQGRSGPVAAPVMHAPPPPAAPTSEPAPTRSKLSPVVMLAGLAIGLALLVAFLLVAR